ncbi:MAG: hypothetical protein LWW76_01380 [Burkholderiales bacterium]|nr:hypothetical protein [Burkholderiales bacterium]
MGQTHIVSGLVTKRAEIDGQIISRLAEIKDLKQVLHHLDRTIKVFSPEFDLRTIRATRTNTRNALFAHGEAQRFVLGVMREHGKAMTSRQMTDAIIKCKGFEIETNTVALIQKNILNVLRRLERKGVVMLSDSNDGILHWCIA